MTKQIRYKAKGLLIGHWREQRWAGVFKENIWGFHRSAGFPFPLQTNKADVPQMGLEFVTLHNYNDIF